eukprot:807965-Alexandrium_andersonii.AAC.1
MRFIEAAMGRSIAGPTAGRRRPRGALFSAESDGGCREASEARSVAGWRIRLVPRPRGASWGFGRPELCERATRLI